MISAESKDRESTREQSALDEEEDDDSMEPVGEAARSLLLLPQLLALSE